jgi:hypothetical protein
MSPLAAWRPVVAAEGGASGCNGQALAIGNRPGGARERRSRQGPIRIQAASTGRGWQMSPIKLRARFKPLAAATASAALAIGAVTILNASPAFADTKGSVTPAASCNPGGKDLVTCAWGVATSGWSPPGKITVSATLTWNGESAGSASTSCPDDTSCVLGPFDSTFAGASGSLKVTATVTGPAGTVKKSTTASG